MPTPFDFVFALPAFAGPPSAPVPAAPFPGVDAIVAGNSYARTDTSDGKIRAIVIHATQGPTSQSAMTRMQAYQASWHWLVPHPGEAAHGLNVWRCVPEALAARHVRNECHDPAVNGDARNANAWAIGIEIVNTMTAGDAFSDWQVEQAAALVRQAWSGNPSLSTVVSHARLDPQNKVDPGAWFPWETFKALVLGG